MSNTQNPSSTLHYATGDLANELATTRRMIARAPAEHYAWRPHEKSFSLGHLVVHLSQLVWWGITNLRDDHFDLGASRAKRALPESSEALLAQFDEGVEVLLSLIADLSEADLEQPWTLRRGDIELFTDTKGNVLRHWCISHIAHHRGQLSVYLRLLNVPVPPSYGPTADEGW